MENKNKDENLITLDEKIKTNEINNEGNQTIKTEEKIEDKKNNENLIIEKEDEKTINKEGDKSFNINKKKENMVEKMEWCEEYNNNIYMNFVDDVSDGLILYYTNNSK